MFDPYMMCVYVFENLAPVIIHLYAERERGCQCVTVQL